MIMELNWSTLEQHQLLQQQAYHVLQSYESNIIHKLAGLV